MAQYFFKQNFILVSESAEQSACGLNPPVPVLNKVVTRLGFTTEDMGKDV